MSGWNRPFGDKFWPVFVGCLVIGVMELAAAGCSLFGELETAIALDQYWFVGFFLSIWLFPELEETEPANSDSVWNQPIGQSSFGIKLLFLGMCVGGFVALWADSLFSAPWYVVVRGTMLGAYLVALSWAAWGAEAKSPKSAGVPKSELISP